MLIKLEEYVNKIKPYLKIIINDLKNRLKKSMMQRKFN